MDEIEIGQMNADPEEEDIDILEDESSDDDLEEVVIHDADAEDQILQLVASETVQSEIPERSEGRQLSELMAILEALIFVSDEPIPTRVLAEVVGEDREWVTVAVEGLAREFNERPGGLMIREVAGGWQIATRAEYHEHVRNYLRTRPGAKLSLAALETLAVIAYKQPITVPEILEIRGVQSSSAIKTLIEKRLVVTKGRKETVGKPMMYGTSKEFLLQFGLKDLSELPSIEDFEDLTAAAS
jgi:segregation and condensation protein B